MHTKFFALLFALVMPLLAACNANVSFDLDDQYTYLTVSMEEADVASLMETLLTSGDSQLQNVNADLRPGEVHVTAEIPADDGTPVQGELIVLIGAENGQLQVEVVSFRFAGISTSDEQIAQWNQGIADGLARSAENNENGAEFTEVTITDTDLTFSIRTPRRNN